MVSLLLQPLVCGDVLEWVFLVDIPIRCKDVNIILRLEPLHQIDNGTDRPASLEGRGVPIAEYEEFCFNVQLFKRKLKIMSLECRFS